MKKANVTKFVKDIKGVAVKHSPEILTAIGIVGMFGSVVSAVKETPKAVKLIEADSRRNHDGDPHAYTKTEAIKSCWKCYIPATISFTLSAACLIGASATNAKRNAALATAYTISEAALADFKEKTKEVIGEKKEKEITEAVAKDKIEKNPVANREVIITGNGNTLCYDTISDRYFESSIDKIKRIENELNRRMLDEMYISVNDLFYELGLNPIKNGDDLGWNVDRGFIDIGFSSQLTEEENPRPCIVLDYRLEPRYGYSCC